MKRFKYTYIAFFRVLSFLMSFLSFLAILATHFEILRYAGSPLAITVIAFSVVYYLMCRVYGGFEIGTKKSKPIVYSYLVNLLATDLFAHLILCILNSTITGNGHFSYEVPLLLLVVYLVQMLLIVCLVYLGNGVYFRFNKPARCLVIKQPGDDERTMVKKVRKLKRQFSIEWVCHRNDPKVFDLIDEADTVFLYNLPVSERAVFVEYCYHNPKEIYYSVEMADIVSMGSERVLFDDMTMMHYRVKEPSFERRLIKRAMDVVVSLIGLVVASPFMLIAAIAIKLEDKGPVFYRQPRVTYKGRIFNVLKFRSMRVEDGSIHRSVTKNDDRITKVGHIIRKFRIDELPQLINILNGDMSIVGPRPEMVENVEKYTKKLPEFAYRQRVKAGLTGMAQIYGKYNTSPADKLALDLVYIENFSLILDIKLILRTVMVLLTPDESTEEFDSTEKEEEKEAQRV